MSQEVIQPNIQNTSYITLIDKEIQINHKFAWKYTKNLISKYTFR